MGWRKACLRLDFGLWVKGEGAIDASVLAFRSSTLHCAVRSDPILPIRYYPILSQLQDDSCAAVPRRSALVLCPALSPVSPCVRSLFERLRGGRTVAFVRSAGSSARKGGRAGRERHVLRSLEVARWRGYTYRYRRAEVDVDIQIDVSQAFEQRIRSAG